MVSEELSHVVLAPPQHRRQRPRRGWSVRSEEPEELGTQPLGGEVDHADRAPGPAHADQLVRDRLMVRREDRAQRGGDDVEFAVAERKRFGVRLDPLELDSLPARLATTGIEELGSGSEAVTFAPA